MQWDTGEFLCPLCQCYNNTVLPLLPQVGQLSVTARLAQPCRKVNMQEWRELVSLALELGSGDSMDTGTVVNLKNDDQIMLISSSYRLKCRSYLCRQAGGYFPCVQKACHNFCFKVCIVYSW